MAALALSHHGHDSATTTISYQSDPSTSQMAAAMQGVNYDVQEAGGEEPKDWPRRSLLASILPALLFPFSASATVSPETTLTASIQTLTYVLDHWDDLVIDCTYADVPRELLEQKNKALLLEKAATNALFDKSVSITSCKVVTTEIREIIKRPPLSNINTALLQLLPLINDDDTALETIERVSYDLTRIDALSFTSRRDYFALNNFDPDQTTHVLNQPGNLLECRRAIASTADQLKRLLSMVKKG